MTDKKAYGFSKTLSGVGVEDAVTRVTAALKENGFGVLTEIDVKATLKTKIDVDFRPYRILGACNPKLAHRALTAEPQIGLLLPCNVVVEEAEGGAKVSFIDPKAMFDFVDNADIGPVATEAETLLRKTLAELS